MADNELARVATLWVFTPEEPEQWPPLFDVLPDAVRERNPEALVRIVDFTSGPVQQGPELWFGVYLGGEPYDGFAPKEPPGVALRDAPAEAAAQFTLWLRDHIVPRDTPLTCNTRLGMEAGLWDFPVPPAPLPDTTERYTEHIREALEALG